MTLARRGAMTMEVVDVEKVIDEYLASPECAKMLEHHGEVRIARKTDRDLLRIKGSPVHLSKTVMNLVTNAAEAIAGEGVITIGLENAYLDRPLPGYDQVEEGCYVRLIVSDTGHGISAEDIRFIFEPFYTRKKMGISGTGLGMAVVWGTVEDHKGYIVVSSAPGEGAVFSLYFPATVELNVVEQMEDLEQYRGRGESILVVDDIREQRIIATEILREFGYRVDAVAGGEEAVDYLRTRVVDLLLLDMIMDPGIDGIETFRQVVRNNPDQRALIASGYSELNQIELARSLGVAGYLRKPYTIAGLARSVRQELDRDRK
jgi:CheY-like chemotaxis protein